MLDYNFLCELCPALCVQFWSDTKGTMEPADAAALHSLFHASCDYCNEVASDCVIQLCDSCRHLRFRHLLLCSPRLFRRLPRVLIQPPKEKSDHCELCKFWETCIHDARESLGIQREEAEDLKHELYIDGHGAFRIWSNRARQGYCTRKGGGEHREWIRALIDWNWLRRWLQESSESEISTYTNFSLHQKLQDVLVVDVLLGCITQLPPSSAYLALSYVWGSDTEGHLCCSRANLSTLSQAGALRDISMPRTISEAIFVCKQLGHRFLWVDRLCIVQDDLTEALSKQLNQMADIYYCAALTLVAATGDNAAHGLAGVSYARDAKQIVCTYGCNFELVTPTPDLMTVLEKGKWWTRGWTFQEYVASKRLLFFTDQGLYLKNGLGQYVKILSEGFSEDSYVDDQVSDLQLLESYTKRNLTKETDILHASAGFLRALYGDRLSYGMPWDDFDHVILWAPDAFDRGTRASTSTEVFPTWSWITSIGPIKVDLRVETIYGLAYWGRPTTGATTTSGSLRWSILEPSHTRMYPKSRFEKDRSERYVVAALSWLHGCLQTEAPSWLSVDCTRDEYAARLEERWSMSPSRSWREAFQDNSMFFENIDTASPSEAGCLMVHTQKACFVLDWGGREQPPVDGSFRPGKRSIIIRNETR
jgi:hypothetical protein